MRKPQFSPTRILTYLACPRKYRFVYVDRLGARYRQPRPYFSFGSSLHRTLEAFHQAGGTETQSVEDLLEQYRDCWTGAGYKSQEEETRHYEAGRQMLSQYWDSGAQEEVETLWTERMLRKDMGHYILTGRIDRLDRHGDGTLEVVDYKSGRLSVSEEDISGDLAIAVYQLLVAHEYRVGCLKASIYCLRSQAKATIERDETALAQMENEVTGMVDAILADTAYACNPAACEDCDFLRICPRR